MTDEVPQVVGSSLSPGSVAVARRRAGPHWPAGHQAPPGGGWARTTPVIQQRQSAGRVDLTVAYED